MSRSYRKPYWTQGYGKPNRQFRKRQANHRVARTKDVANNGGYRKLYNHWDIVDWKIYDKTSRKVRNK